MPCDLVRVRGTPGKATLMLGDGGVCFHKYKACDMENNRFLPQFLVRIVVDDISNGVYNGKCSLGVATLITKKFGRKNSGREIIGREIFGRFFSKFRTVSDKISDKISDSYIQKPAKFGQKNVEMRP